MQLPAQLLKRKTNSHKGSFGRILILAGSAEFSGAALLCCEAALRSGAGVVTLGIPKSLNLPILRIKPKEVITLPLPETKSGTISNAALYKIKKALLKIDILVMGPGLSRNQSTQKLLRTLIASVNNPMVLDADALNALSHHLSLLKSAKGEKICTPHPAEMARLLEVSPDQIQSNRKKVALEFSRNYKCTLVLKGHHTLVADYSKKIYKNLTGNPGMATAGSGDVLTGIIAAFLGQRLNPFQSAKFAVYLHGLAGDLAAKEKTEISLIASDIIAKIPEAIKLAKSL